MPVIHKILIPLKCKLSATLTVPGPGYSKSEGKFPAVVMVAAVGDNNRDGKAGGLDTQIFSKLADMFDRLGFATLRYDKRGCGKSEGDYYSSGLHDSINDAVKAVRFLKSRVEVDPDRILIVGHSEGAIIAPAIYHQEKTAGVILLSGAAEPGSELMSLPFKKCMAELFSKHSLSGIKGFLSRLFRFDKIVKFFYENYHKKVMTTNNAVIRFFGIKCNAVWYRESYNFDVRNHLQRLHCPTLVIGGSKDIQSTPDYVQQIVDLVPGRATSHVIPNMTHLLREDPTGQYNMLNCFGLYKKSLSSPLSKVMEEKIEQWVLDNSFCSPK